MIDFKKIIIEKKETIKNILILLVILIIGGYCFFINNNYESIEETTEIDVLNSQITNEKANNESTESTENEKIKVYIIGEVKTPGVVELEKGSRLEDAIILAGGTTDESDLSRVNLAYVLEDGQKIYIPSINESVSSDSESNYEISQSSDGIITDSNSEKESKININTADVEKLCELSGVGEALANRIIEYREENGKFETIEELKNVSGIGDKKYENIKEYICVK